MRFHALDHNRYARACALACGALALGACENLIPAGAIDLADRPELLTAYAAWTGPGDPRTCPAPYLARVSTETFEAGAAELTHVPTSSCSRLPMPYMWGRCELAFTNTYEHGMPAIIFMDENMHTNTPASEGILTHELLHAWSFCLTGDPDGAHATNIWHSDPFVKGALPSDWERIGK